MDQTISLVLLKLIHLGFLDFIVFSIVMAILYALLRKSKILSESPIINGIVSFGVAFMVFVFPIITGVSVVIPLSKFFTQATVFIIVFLFSFLIASFFYPNLVDWLPKVFTSRNTLFSMIGLGIAIFITSGLVAVIYQSATAPSQPTQKGIFPVSGGNSGSSSIGGTDIYILVAGLVIFIVILLISSSIGRAK